MGGFFFFQNHFSGIDGLKEELKSVKNNLRSERVKVAIAEYQLEDYRQTVATYIPKAVKAHSDYGLRSLASISQLNDSGLKISDPTKIVENGQKLCAEERFARGQVHLKDYIENFPMGKKVIEAHFLLHKCYMDAGDIADGISVTELMAKRYPESELTALALINSGDVYIARDRYVDAKFMFQLVRKNFKAFPQVQKALNQRRDKWDY